MEGLMSLQRLLMLIISLMTACRGEIPVTITSAKTNPSALGGLDGLMIELEDKTIDLSVASRITKLNKLLTEKIY
ncbi:11624_t:CDS:2 [Diversispora eburnea]|uniref:11624_t:CDS:1 n=1 Tax=Diversispora eburnea TaxID=1213867 RepID=A0A9N8ZMC5_9GLOM|nr:11624_t:CDS:2 [Diversispora eburnea]